MRYSKARAIEIYEFLGSPILMGRLNKVLISEVRSKLHFMSLLWRHIDSAYPNTWSRERHEWKLRYDFGTLYYFMMHSHEMLPPIQSRVNDEYLVELFEPQARFNEVRAQVVYEFLGCPIIKFRHKDGESLDFPSSRPGMFLTKMKHFVNREYPGVFMTGSSGGELKYNFSNLYHFATRYDDVMSRLNIDPIQYYISESDSDSDSESDSESEYKEYMIDGVPLEPNEIAFPECHLAGGGLGFGNRDGGKVDPVAESDLTSLLTKVFGAIENGEEKIDIRAPGPELIPEFDLTSIDPPFVITHVDDHDAWKIFIGEMSEPGFMSFTPERGWHGSRFNPLGPRNSTIADWFDWEEILDDDRHRLWSGTTVEGVEAGEVAGLSKSITLRELGDDSTIMTVTTFKIPSRIIYQDSRVQGDVLMTPEYITRLMIQMSILVSTIALSGRRFIAFRLKVNGIMSDVNSIIHIPGGLGEVPEEELKNIQTIHTSDIEILEMDFREHVSKLEEAYDIEWVDSIEVRFMTMPPEGYNRFGERT